MSAHCNSMAGSGELCSHIGAILFFIDATVQIRNSKTVTEEKPYWILPISLKSVPYAEVVDINFTSPDTLFKMFIISWCHCRYEYSNWIIIRGGSGGSE